MEIIEPTLDWCLAKKVQRDTGVVTGTDIRDTHQLWEIIAVGPGVYEFGTFVVPSAKAGDIVYTDEHAEANTPKELEAKDMALFKAARIMAIVTEGK